MDLAGPYPLKQCLVEDEVMMHTWTVDPSSFLVTRRKQNAASKIPSMGEKDTFPR